MINLCTYFDRQYLPQGLALLESIKRFHPKATIYVLALDDETHDLLWEKYQHNNTVIITPLALIENLALLSVKARRSWKDYIFTLTPRWCQILMDSFKLESLAYIDADCYLFGPLTDMYDRLEDASIGVTPHRWTPRLQKRLHKSGDFNVGWVYWRNDDVGRACLARWMRQCLDWTGKKDSFSDQIYLNEWPALYGDALHQVDHPGANLAPWNQEQYHYRSMYGRLCLLRPPSKFYSERILSVMFYHFHELKMNSDGEIYRSGYDLKPEIVDHLYKPYEAIIRGFAIKHSNAARTFDEEIVATHV